MTFKPFIEVFILFSITILAAIITVSFQSQLIISVFLFFGIPSLYLTFRASHVIWKCFSFAFLMSIPLSLFVDTLAAINKAWIVSSSFFTFKFFGVATIDVFIFGFLWVFYAVIFYEHFFGGNIKWSITPSRIAQLVCINLMLILYVCAGIFFDNGLLYIPYYYFCVSVALVIVPMLIFLLFHPVCWHEFLAEGVFFFVLLFLFEIAALATRQWIFPGSEFVGFIHIFNFSIPVEELIMWMLFATPGLLSYYKYFWN